MIEKVEAAEDIEALAAQVRQHREEIDQLKKALEQLQTELDLLEPDSFEEQIDKNEIFEFATTSNDVIKGKINWTNAYLISVTTAEEGNDPPAEVLLFKHAIAYIRKPEKKLIPRRGMYI